MTVAQRICSDLKASYTGIGCCHGEHPEDSTVRHIVTDALSHTGPTIGIVVHAAPGVGSSFWNTWESGARNIASLMTGRVVWRATSYNATTHVASIEELCASTRALVVTVPFQNGTDAYKMIDDAINACISTHDRVVFIANTDTYGNQQAYGYIGSQNYEMGKQCARLILTGDIGTAFGRYEMETSNIDQAILDGEVGLHTFMHPLELANHGIARRIDGFQKVIRDHVTHASGNYSNLDAVNTAASLQQGHHTMVAFGIGAYNYVTKGSSPQGNITYFNCGDDMHVNASFLGQSVYKQGATAATSAFLASSEFAYHGVLGNPGACDPGRGRGGYYTPLTTKCTGQLSGVNSGRYSGRSSYYRI